MKRRHHLALKLAGILVLIISAWGGAASSQASGGPTAPAAAPSRANELIIGFHHAADADASRGLLAAYGLAPLGQWPALGAVLVQAPSDLKIDLAAQLQRDPAVRYVELNYLATGFLTPNDPDYRDPARVYAPQRIHAEQAWDITTGSADVIVAVVDSGVSFDHPEFSGRLLPGWDFVNNDADPSDDSGHGTHVAGIIAAAMNNGQGSAGLAPGVQILPVKVLNNYDFGSYADIASGIVYAADQGARIINLSSGGSSPSILLEDAVLYASSRNALVITAAGNTGLEQPSYPAAYDAALAVAATTAADTRWELSSTGPFIDLAAPGDAIWSTYWQAANSQTYAFASGTSTAAPHVAGLAALIVSLRPDMDATTVRTLIEQTALDLGAPGWDSNFGHGRIEAGAALIAAQSWGLPTPTVTSSPSPTPAATATATPTATPIPYLQRVNVAGPNYVDTQGRLWSADQAWNGVWGGTGGAYRFTVKPVALTNNDPLYQRWREGPGQYQFSVPNGTYQVMLSFADFDSNKASDRLIQVKIEGFVVESALSIYGLVGKATALDRTYETAVSDGILTIQFAQAGGRKVPIFAGIEVRRQP